MNKEHESALIRRCPRLGGAVSFHYCRCGESIGDPCFKIIDCWWELFDVVAYLRDTLPEQRLQRLVHAAPKPKIASLVELAETVKSRHD